MPVISFVSGKGGVGKTTSAVLLATTIAEDGASVTLLDADPNQPIAAWAERTVLPAKLTVIPDTHERNIKKRIAEAEAETAFVIADIAGSKNAAVANAVEVSNLALVPAQGSQLDIKEAVETIKFARKQFEREGATYRLFMTRTHAAVRGKTLRHIETSIAEAGLLTLRTEIGEREAFKTLFSVGGTLSGYDFKLVSGLTHARENATAFAAEVLSVLREVRAAA